MRLSKTLLLTLAAATTARAAITYEWFVNDIAVTENKFKAFEQEAASIHDLKSGYKAMNKIGKFFVNGVKAVKAIKKKLPGTKFSKAQQQVVCDQLSTLFELENQAMQFFASRRHFVKHASPTMFSDATRNIRNLRHAQGNFVASLGKYLPACKKQLNTEWKATNQELIKTFKVWNFKGMFGPPEDVETEMNGGK